jgi:hypothetical protein
MRYMAATILTVAGLCFAGTPALAHQITYKGTVIAFEKTAEPEMALRVNVVDSETKETSAMTFYVDAETKILRGDALVAMAEAGFVQGETVTVTVDHDLDEELAIVVRLDPKA